MRVADLLEGKENATLITVRATDSLKHAVARLDLERIGAMMVVNDRGHLVGMLSERDLVGVLAEYGERAMLANVGALMTRRILACHPDDAIEDALSWMVHHRVRHLPVVEEGKVRGLISIGDVARRLVVLAAHEPTRVEGNTVEVPSREA